eukprot:3758730-Rhodomonas_salina.2
MAQLGRRGYSPETSRLIAHVSASILLILLCGNFGEASVESGTEYYIEKYLRERTAWLDSKFPVSNALPLSHHRPHAIGVCFAQANLRFRFFSVRLQVADEDLEAEIEKFVLAPINTTVRCLSA